MQRNIQEIRAELNTVMASAFLRALSAHAVEAIERGVDAREVMSQLEQRMSLAKLWFSDLVGNPLGIETEDCARLISLDFVRVHQVTALTAEDLVARGFPADRIKALRKGLHCNGLDFDTLSIPVTLNTSSALRFASDAN